MNGPIDPTTVTVPPRLARAPRSAGAPNRASFARALRQRGLLALTELLPAVTDGWADTPRLWLAGMSVYEAHLRRVAMEQVFATLRGDRAANE
jgi:hypothetical protein